MQSQLDVSMAVQEMGQAEALTIQVLGVATPVLTALSMLLFLVFTLLLVFRTRQQGRWLIFSGLVLFGGFGLYQWLRFPNLDAGLLGTVLAEFVPMLALLLIMSGYGRLVWSLRKQA